MKCAVLLLVLCLLGLGPRQAHAHQSSLSYATIERGDSDTVVRYGIRLSSNDLYEALELGEDRDATDEEIQNGSERLNRYVFQRVRLTANAGHCTFLPGTVVVKKEGQRFALAVGELQCERPIQSVSVHYELFFDLDARHEGLLRSGTELYQLNKGNREIAVDLEGGSGTSILGFAYSGWQHVIYGFDHILFLLGLLIVVALGPKEQVRGVRDTCFRTAGIVSAFTLAHSMTLISAALGWFSLPSRFVESAIAVSILYVALENIVALVPQRRHWVSFFFGLVHGMGFAAMLRPILPPGDSAFPLLLFNLGVEAGQLTVVAFALPVLFVLLRFLGVKRYRRFIVTITSLLLSFLALVWLLERAGEMTILGL